MSFALLGPHPHSLSRGALTLSPLPEGEGKLVRIHISVEVGWCVRSFSATAAAATADRPPGLPGA
jgi:hypothetical protein